MRIALIGGLVLVSIAIGCHPKSSAPISGEAGEPDDPSMPAGAMDWKQMQGTWKIVESSRTGEGNQRDLETTIRFEQNKMTFSNNDGKPHNEWHFGVGFSQSPKHLDLVSLDPAAKPKVKSKNSKGPQADVPIVPGIYDLNGDQLVLVIDWTVDSSKRPTNLDEKPEGQTVRYRLERVK
jgi:uncharacterized protein (TIGR03067 family)